MDLLGGGGLMGGGGGNPTSQSNGQTNQVGKVVLAGSAADGMQIRSSFVLQGGRVHQQICVENQSGAPLSGFAVQYNKNSFGLVPESPGALGSLLPASLAPGQSATALLPLLSNGPLSDSKGQVQMAVKNNVKVYYFADVCEITSFLSAEGRLDRGVFLEQWKGIQGEVKSEVGGLSGAQENVEGVCQRMEAASVFFIARRKLPDGADMVYFSVKTLNGAVMLAEVGFRPGSGSAVVCVKAPQPHYVPMFAEALAKLIRG